MEVDVRRGVWGAISVFVWHFGNRFSDTLTSHQMTRTYAVQMNRLFPPLGPSAPSWTSAMHQHSGYWCRLTPRNVECAD